MTIHKLKLSKAFKKAKGSPYYVIYRDTKGCLIVENNGKAIDVTVEGLSYSSSYIEAYLARIITNYNEALEILSTQPSIIREDIPF